MENNNLLLQVNNLSVQYSSGGRIIHAVNDVSFSLDKGKTLALVGETGAGKTTIAKSILRILPEPQGKITAGEVIFNGDNLLDYSQKRMREIRGGQISMIFQDPMTALNPVLTIGDQIADVFRKHQEQNTKTALEQAGDMLELVGIPRERVKEYPHQFSGGMRQRVVIAIALACKPALILADEPTTALDVTIQAQVLNMIAELRKQITTAMILITHDLAVVAETADSVAIVYGGEILEYADKMDLYLHPDHPYTKGLFGAIPDVSTRVKRLANIKGLPPDPANLPKGCCFAPRCPHATDQCINHKPELREIAPGHFSKCWLNTKEEGE